MFGGKKCSWREVAFSKKVIALLFARSATGGFGRAF